MKTATGWQFHRSPQAVRGKFSGILMIRSSVIEKTRFSTRLKLQNPPPKLRA
jgi:hypothetical protein